MQSQKARTISMFRSAIRRKLSDSACMQDEETDFIFYLIQEPLHVSIDLELLGFLVIGNRLKLHIGRLLV